ILSVILHRAKKKRDGNRHPFNFLCHNRALLWNKNYAHVFLSLFLFLTLKAAAIHTNAPIKAEKIARRALLSILKSPHFRWQAFPNSNIANWPDC
ncbi:hypothetical protein ACSILC_002822, partial [Listeria monocytogenes]